MDNLKLPIVVKGRNGIVTAFEDRIEISRKNIVGFLTQGLKGVRIIRFEDMTSIEAKTPGLMSNGYIQFIINPELAAIQKVGLIGTSNESMRDPNAVVFSTISKNKIKEFTDLRDFSLSRIAYYQGLTSTQLGSGLNDLSKLKQLLDDGVITQEDFDAKKKQILGI